MPGPAPPAPFGQPSFDESHPFHDDFSQTGGGFRAVDLVQCPVQSVQIMLGHDATLLLADRISANRCLAENNLDFTVFSGMPIASPISSYDNSPK
jgi:hypothetical protein